MIDGKRVLALIPARGGSKGIPGKNTKLLAGKPLIAYTIEAALESEFVDCTVVTTDSEEIAEVSRRYGAEVPFMRPSHLAGDQAKTIDCVVHALDELKNMGNVSDILLLLQPTSPLRTKGDIDGALQLYSQNREPASVVGVSEAKEHPILLRYFEEKRRLNSLLGKNSTVRRQDMEKYYIVNGSIYIFPIKDITSETSFNDGKLGYIMDGSHSIDIDEPMDFIVAEQYLLS